MIKKFSLNIKIHNVKDIEVIYKRNGLIDIIFIDNIEQEPNLLKMSLSIYIIFLNYFLYF